MSASGALALPDLVPESRAVLARHARSFQLASWFLPASVRDDAALCYAFCRAVDDAVDRAPDPGSGRLAADELEAELRGKRAPRPLIVAWRHMALRRRMPSQPAYDLVEGARSDTTTVRLADDDALVRYSYLVAGTVGLMMCALLGVRDRAARRHAVDLGIAMQLTNICRDVKEDAAMGRVYLPESRLRAQGTSSEALLAGLAPREAVAAVVRDLLDLADTYYASADAGMAAIPLRARLAIVTAARLYRGIGETLRRRGCDALAGRAIPGTLARSWALVRAVVWWGAHALARFDKTRHVGGLHAALSDRLGAHTLR